MSVSRQTAHLRGKGASITPWTAAAIVGAAVVGAAASNSASKKGERAAGDANQLQADMYYQNREDQEPWRQAGIGALGQLSQGLGVKNQSTFNEQAYLASRPDAVEWLKLKAELGQPATAFDHYTLDGARQAEAFPQEGAGGSFGDFNRDFTLADFQKDPGYEFRLNQGLDAVQGSRAARGSMMSGATLKALQDYGSDYASSEFGKAYDRFNNDRTQRFNRLATIAGIGQTATNNVGTAGANFANNQSSNLYSGANASAAGSIGMANAIGSGLSNLQSLYQLNQMNSGGGYASGGSPVGYYEGSATGPVYVP